jgi:hypothetical protein
VITEAEAAKLPPTMVPAKAARFDPRAQSRAAMCPEWVEDFRGLLREGRDLAPGVFFREGAVYWAASGFHRGAAYVAEAHAYIPGHVLRGTLEDAILFSAGTNRLPGCLRRTNEDKRRAVQMTLEHSKASGWSEVQIAEHCGVSRHLVQAMKEEARGGRMPPGQAGGASEDDEGGPDEETVGRRESQLPRSTARLLKLCDRLEALRPGLRAVIAVASQLPESLRRAAMKVVAQCEEIAADPHAWVDDAVKRRAERPRKR